jgi:HEAT repeat protein
MDPVFERCGDENEQVRKAVIENLALIEDDRTEAMLAAAIASDTAPVRAAAARALANVGVFDARPMLRNALEDRDVWVRYHAAKSLATLKRLDDDTLNTLTRLVREDAAQQVRIAAVEAVATAKTADIISFLAEAASSEAAELAQAAVTALGSMREVPTLPYLLAALASSVTETRLVAVAALGASGLPASVEHLWRLTNDDNPNLAAAAIEALGNLDCEEAVSELVEFSRLPRWRESCIRLLSGTAPARLGVLARGLQHPDVDVRRSVVEALTRSRHSSAWQILRSALSDAEACVRYAAMTALAQGGISR